MRIHSRNANTGVDMVNKVELTTLSAIPLAILAIVFADAGATIAKSLVSAMLTWGMIVGSLLVKSFVNT